MLGGLGANFLPKYLRVRGDLTLATIWQDRNLLIRSEAPALDPLTPRARPVHTLQEGW
jgi:hypothetical protein